MITLDHPFTETAVRALRAGEAVRVSGRVCTGRDRLHKHLAEGGACPADLRDGALFHCGLWSSRFRPILRNRQMGAAVGA